MKIDGGCQCGFITYEAEADGLDADQVIERIFQHVRTP